VHPQPKRRTTHAYGTPKNLLVYDRWGSFGRPVVLLHGLLFDRTMWWPVAADLGDSCAAVAVDLPGHGDSAPREHYRLDQLTHDLAMLISRLDLRRAPVLVGHGEAALMAEAFADRYATHAVITVGTAAAGRDATDDALQDVPELYRQFAVPRDDRELLDAYLERLTWPPARTRTAAPAPARIYAGNAPKAHLGDERFPHLRDPAAFAAQLRSVC
jgi:pimeloyl-ACP methyl ester carboxylesterase